MVDARKSPSHGGRRQKWAPLPLSSSSPLAGEPRRAKLGRPLLEATDPKMAERIRAALLRGDSVSMIVEAEGCGTSVITRIRREIEAEQGAVRRGLLEQVVEAAVKGGMSRKKAADLIHRATGIQLT